MNRYFDIYVLKSVRSELARTSLPHNLLFAVAAAVPPILCLTVSLVSIHLPGETKTIRGAMPTNAPPAKKAAAASLLVLRFTGC